MLQRSLANLAKMNLELVKGHHGYLTVKQGVNLFRGLQKQVNPGGTTKFSSLVKV
ncbi:hypothetical protein L1O48_03120 [Ligilactobacillus equi]|uniref:hypothetical protein n=1 Tax=Ligilactobacillus equi TaxID=137357 RepID=UPI0004050E00|nr:hypothetical protein [Ligilactobacillus equi]MCQ2557132.1 hypothetical protein [Ligilactobacillus sp.]